MDLPPLFPGQEAALTAALAADAPPKRSPAQEASRMRRQLRHDLPPLPALDTAPYYATEVPLQGASVALALLARIAPLGDGRAHLRRAHRAFRYFLVQAAFVRVGWCRGRGGAGAWEGFKKHLV